MQSEFDQPEIAEFPRLERPEEIVEETLSSSVPVKPLEKTGLRAPEKTESREKLAAAKDDRPTARQKAPGPRTDNWLAELLNRDLEKATERPIPQRQIQFSKALLGHKRVRYYVDYFSKSGKEHFAKVLARSGRYVPMMAKILREEGLPEDFVYLALIESAFVTDATSPSGAVGLWQFIPGTAIQYGLKIDSWIDERRDPWKSTEAAAAYLKELHQSFGRWYLAMAAYNGGSRALEKAVERSGSKELATLDQEALSEQTRNFVPKFVAATVIARDPKKYGFKDVPYEKAAEFDEVVIRGTLKLNTVAELADATVEEIQELNPQLLRHYTPPGDEEFQLKLPPGKGTRFAKAYEDYKESTAVQVVTHKVKRGETLFSIARYYGQVVSDLMALNSLTTPRLRVGQQLMVILEGLGKIR